MSTATTLRKEWDKFSQEDILAASLVAAAPLLLFFGARLYRPAVFLTGFGVGGYFTYELIKPDQVSVPTQVAVSCAAGLATGLILWWLHRVGLVALGLTVGALAGNLGFNMLGKSVHEPSSDYEHFIWCLACSIIAGTITQFFASSLLKLLTSIVGGYAGAAGLEHWAHRWKLLPPTDPPVLAPGSFFFTQLRRREWSCSGDACHALLALWGALAVLGLVVQCADLADACCPCKTEDDCGCSGCCCRRKEKLPSEQYYRTRASSWYGRQNYGSLREAEPLTPYLGPHALSRAYPSATTAAAATTATGGSRPYGTQLATMA